MSEKTPERLKAFREQYGPSSRKSGWLPWLAQFVMLIAGFAAILYMQQRGTHQEVAPAGGLQPETQRRLALYLAEKKDAPSAIEAYQKYLQSAALSLPEQSKIYFAMATLALDADMYDRALPLLYQAEFLDPNSEVKGEISKKVVLCLDKLGRGADLRHELRDRASVTKKQSDVQPGEKVLAEFADQVITDRDLEQEIEKLPASMRDSVSAPDQKVEFLKNMVAQRLLLDKARRLELDKTPEIQDQLVQALDSLIVQKLIADEVRAGVQTTPEDVERFYKAEIARFTQPATAEVIVAKSDTEEGAKAAEFKDKPVIAAKGRPLPGVPEGVKADEQVFAAEPGAIVGPIKAEDGWYALKVVSKKPENVLPFEQVKDQAARMLQSQKEQEKVRALIEETLQARDVKLHLEQLKGAEGAGQAK
jgi:peptidyl-prolyl cis-trans isomerase C